MESNHKSDGVQWQGRADQRKQQLQKQKLDVAGAQHQNDVNGRLTTCGLV